MTQKFHPILFSTPMVQAILAGNKTMTRRVVKPQPPGDYGFSGTDVDRASGEPIFYACWEGDDNFHNVKCPYGQPGDILWVRESFHYANIGNGMQPFYKADHEMPHGYKRPWKPSIHMPKSACRLFLQIKSIRVERLQDINYVDAKAEGVEFAPEGKRGEYNGYKNYLFKTAHPKNGEEIKDEYHRTVGYGSPKKSFQTLWQKINGLESWNANPFVWVVEFTKIEKPEGFL